jgi:hypothetical protein
MDPRIIQNLRYKLQKRVSRLHAIDTDNGFIFTLPQFWRFFDRQPIFIGIIQELLTQFPDIERDVDRIFAGEALYGETEEEAAALGYKVLRRLTDPDNELQKVGIAYRRASRSYPAREAIIEIHLEPFYEYVDEQLDDQRAALALLVRYKHRSEWFHHERLWQLSTKDTRNAEKSLALDLYAYLYDQGIDFNIETESIRGRIDLIAAQETDDPLLLDAKIFDNGSRDKYYIRKAFCQIYTYTQHFNEAFGYLIIFNTSGKDLRLSLQQSGGTPVLVHNHKTIFFVLVDIFPHEKPVSQRSPLKVVEITEEEFITILEE